jgi:flavodoxin
MKTLITYFSETGNTKKVAEGIYEVISGDKELVDITDLDIDTLNNFDLIFLGSPVHAQSAPGKVKKVLKQFPEDLGAKIALFITHGVPDESFYENCFKILNKYCSKKNLEVIGEFKCLGKHSSMELLSSLFPNKVDDAKKSEGHPDQADLESVKEFAQTILDKL